MKKMLKIAILSTFFAVVLGCQSTKLSQVDDGAPENPINSPEQSQRIIQEHTPR